uniref:PH domain-containing protein n=1 Tax=Parastrongyloides trichosuri TaxID=131310 RepID=A0A0N4ZTR8_PARTI
MQCVEQLFFCKNICSGKSREQFLAKDEIDCFRANIAGGENGPKYPSSEHKSLNKTLRIPVPSLNSQEVSLKSNIKGLSITSNKVVTKGSSNALLKQALANRINNPQLNESNTKDTIPKETQKIFENQKNDEDKNKRIVSRKSSDEMSSSILLSPAWYRDSEGKTGVKEKEWEKMPNQQKSPVKHKNDKKKGDKKIDDENIYETIKNDKRVSPTQQLYQKDNMDDIISDTNDYLNITPNDNKHNRRVSLNSDQSKLSSMSRKSVTFSDQVVINEISRRLDDGQNINFKIDGTFDDSFYSDEEIPSTLTAVTIIRNNPEVPLSHLDSSLEVSRELQKEFNEHRKDHNDLLYSTLPQQFSLGPNVEKSIYFDESLGANVYLLDENPSEDEYEFDAASLNLPDSVKRALKAEALARKKDLSEYERDITIGCLYGSMSKLHAEDSPNISLRDLRNNSTNISRENSYKKYKKQDISIDDRPFNGEASECSKLTTEIGEKEFFAINPHPNSIFLSSINRKINILKMLPSNALNFYNNHSNNFVGNNLLDNDIVVKPNNLNLSNTNDNKNITSYLSPNLSKKEYKKKKNKDNITSSSSEEISPDYDYHRSLSTITGSPNPSHNSRITTKSSPSLVNNSQKPPPGNISPRSNSVISPNLTIKDNENNKLSTHKPFVRSASGYFEPPDLSKQIIHHVEIDIPNKDVKSNDLSRIPKLLPPKEFGGDSIQRSYYDNVSYGGVFTPSNDGSNEKIVISNEIVNNINLTPKVIVTEEKDLETIYKEKFMNTYSKRKAPLVKEESEEIAPRDPDHTPNYGLGPDNGRVRKDSMTSNSSRESVISATSYKAEAKVRRNFNY